MTKISTYGFSHARTALKYGLAAFKIRPNQQILLPSYICDVVTHPILSLGLQPIFYEVKEDLSPDWGDLNEKVTGQTACLMMVHYFGFYQDIPKFQQFCMSKKLILIEDNAHGFGGTFCKASLGTFGHIGISSPRKSYKVFNGAYLYLRNKDIDINHLSSSSRNKWVTRLKAYLMSIINQLPFNYPNFGSQDEFEEGIIPDKLIDQDSHAYLQMQSYQDDRQKRVQLFKIWLDWSLTNQLKPVFQECRDGCIPLVFPAYTASHGQSEKWFEWGRKNSIRISSWPRLPREVVGVNSSAMKIWESLICFPIELNMDPAVLQRKLSGVSPP